MRTDDLIRALSSDREAATSPVRALSVALAIGVAIALVWFAFMIGLRSNLPEAATSLRFVLKPVEMLILAGAAVVLVLRLAQPGAPLRRAMLAAAIAPALMIAAVVVELLVVPKAEWLVRLAGEHWWICVPNMVVLALPMLAAILWGLRSGAPTRPALAGAGAGLLAGALSATLYIAQCPDDSPLFVAVWFVGAIAIVTAIGAALGPRVLRW